MSDLPTRPPTPAEQRLIATLEPILAAAADHRPAPSCYGFMRVRVQGRERVHLLGSRTSIDRHATVLDWQRAPLAQVFFGVDLDEEYEVEIDDRVLTGTLLERGLLALQRGQLVEIQTSQVLLQRSEPGWLARRASAEHRLPATAPGERRANRALTRLDLDPTQRQATKLPAARDLLILGDAGFGKTTVALYRLHWLKEALGAGEGERAPWRPLDALVLVPTEGLRRLTVRILEQLALSEVAAYTVDQWLTEQARALFPDLPEGDSQDAGAAVIRVKRHPALAQVLPVIAVRKRGPARRRDLFHLFGDRALLDQVAQAADGAISPRAIDEVITHTVVQFSDTTETEYAHVDADRLVTVDRRAIDEGTPMGDAHTMDQEDAPVMFAVHRLRTGTDRTKAGRLRQYRHVLIDEAQELAPLELAVIGRARAPGGSLIVAGDAQQQVDETAYHTGWEATMADLGAADHERVVLQQNYRCPPAIEQLARAIRYGEATTDALASPESITMTQHRNPCHQSAVMIEQLRALLRADPRASIAVICRTAAVARRMEANLARALPTWLALSGAFGFAGGVDVTCVAEVKGLEFDHVIIPDADANSYRGDPRSSRALYVAVTRPLHHLWLSCVDTWSPLLAKLPIRGTHAR